MPTSTEQRRVALLGADTIVGRHLLPALEAKGYESIPAVEVASSDPLRTSARLYDSSDAASLAEAMAGAMAVIDARCWRPRGLSVREARKEGVRRSRVLVEAVRRSGPARTVVVSDAVTLGDRPNADGVVDASSFHLPGSDTNAVVEGLFSMEAELYRSIGEGLDIPIVLPSMVVGPGDAGRDASLVVELLQGAWPALPVGSIELVDARDLARAIVTGLEAGRSGRRYPVTAGAIRVEDLTDRLAIGEGARHVRRLPEKPPGGAARLVEAIAAVLDRPVRVESALADIRSTRIRDTKARGELSFVARPVGKTLDDSVRWYADAFGWTG